MTDEQRAIAQNIKLLLTDCDGVLTDGGVYYGENGEVLKKFNIRDGMGVERLRNLAGIETGIITGELSPSVAKRAEKLKITQLHLGSKDKPAVLRKIIAESQIDPSQIAYIGDDCNDLEIMALVGFTACPADAMGFVKEKVNYICQSKGGEGCFREFAELLISAK
ncbi:3-deoxy-D-manno-octulosonate 8-phosphate phosphatase [Mucilaginibacter sp. PPCGB 2223]|uniref:KdsC family phosphatase n=1 Tax=Mucilaginibacter sp. PPCGB 2223 TaxID=1886027 RepID=UPI0008246F90|nr:HAD-IIIA family hydrolase [Mucilaginibacter sp. PPCGB 2223]OCX52850.1 3-deoxy-D-manno-octulosonate 8-phosphate phosphatase [Mucilaginibacter sp. PPCGB 2223]